MKKILIIEDDQIVGNIYRNKLRVEGYTVELALDGDTGYELLNSFEPDALITDLVLPKSTGVEFIRKMRSEPRFSKTPIIVLSNTYLTNMVQDAWKAGATKCLCKSSCTPKQVIEAIRTVLASSPPSPAVSSTASRSASTSIATEPASSPATRPAAAAQPATQMSDREFLDDLRKSFIVTLPETLTTFRTLIKNLTKADNETTRVTQARELYRRTRTLTGNAGVAGLACIAQLTDALEALLKELCEKPANFNPSTLRTVASAVDFLGWLFDRATLPGADVITEARVLVVDDELLSRRAITFALDKAKLKSISAEDPTVALKLVTENPFDLIFLDVDMPGMTGFELCTKIRALSRHWKTPVIFVTSLTGFETRANSTMSGGNDFIAKPFIFVELSVKALVYVIRARMESQPRPATVAPTPALAAR
ncbi:MAG: response regulator [Verrucomicrobia bacterium]|nr:response regulator [Verrucomicrobiota bacterium]